MHQRFATEQWLPFPRSLVFAFFANPAHLPPLMPSWQRARIDEVTLVPPPERPAGVPRYPGVAAGSGTTLLITTRVGPGVPIRQPWLARIEDFRWNDHFCDVQEQGPFRFWRHCHSVREASQGGQAGTVVRDEVEYTLPLWPASRPALPLGQAALGLLFGFRQRAAERLVARFARSVQASRS